MWAVITRSGRRCRTKTNMNMHELEGENRCSLINACMTENDAHTRALLGNKWNSNVLF